MIFEVKNVSDRAVAVSLILAPQSADNPEPRISDPEMRAALAKLYVCLSPDLASFAENRQRFVEAGATVLTEITVVAGGTFAQSDLPLSYNVISLAHKSLRSISHGVYSRGDKAQTLHYVLTFGAAEGTKSYQAAPSTPTAGDGTGKPNRLLN